MKLAQEVLDTAVFPVFQDGQRNASSVRTVPHSASTATWELRNMLRLNSHWDQFKPEYQLYVISEIDNELVK